jgi:hypothetical protein
MSTTKSSPHSFKSLPKPRIEEGWGILNKFGEFWTPTTFESPDLALAHLKQFWRNDDKVLEDFTFVPITRTITIRPDGEPTYRVMVAREMLPEATHG